MHQPALNLEEQATTMLVSMSCHVLVAAAAAAAARHAEDLAAEVGLVGGLAAGAAA